MERNHQLLGCQIGMVEALGSYGHAVQVCISDGLEPMLGQWKQLCTWVRRPDVPRLLSPKLLF